MGCTSSAPAAAPHKIVESEDAHSAPPSAVPVQSTAKWADVKNKLVPLSEKTPEAQAARSTLWGQIDVNGNGLLSLAEIDKGLRDNFEIEEVFDAKPAIMRAFQAAKATGGKGDNPDYIDRREFRILIVYLYHYFILFEAFETLTQENENRFDYEEFQKGIKHLNIEVDDPKAEFDSMAEAGGHVLFTDFCNWALKKNLDVDNLEE